MANHFFVGRLKRQDLSSEIKYAMLRNETVFRCGRTKLCVSRSARLREPLVYFRAITWSSALIYPIGNYPQHFSPHPCFFD